MDCLKALFKKFCNKEIIFYLIFGVLTTLVSLIVYYFCTLAFLNPQNAVQLQIANIISWVLSVAFLIIFLKSLHLTSFMGNAHLKLAESMSWSVPLKGKCPVLS